MKTIKVFNKSKGKLETVSFEFTPENTTRFGNTEGYDIFRVADAFGGLLIQETGHTYPIFFDDVSRSDIGDDQQKALTLLRKHT